MSFARKKTHQHADLIQHGIQNNNQTSKIIRFSKTSGFVCKPRVFEQTLEKLRFWICKVYIYIHIKLVIERGHHLGNRLGNVVIQWRDRFHAKHVMYRSLVYLASS